MGRPGRAAVARVASTVTWALAVELALVAVFAVRAWRLTWIADDGYIYLTYVQNWVENGRGPNFAAGERVEGYTSVAWFLLVSLADLLRPDRLLTLEQVAQLVGMVVATTAAALWIPVERTAAHWTARPGAGDRPVVLNVPLALFAGGYVFATYATSGLETPLIMLWVVAVAWAIWRPSPRLEVLAVLGGIGPLVRPDLGIVSAGLVAAVAFGWWRRRRVGSPISPGRTAWLVAAFVAPLLVSTIVRIGYYAQLAPNTYYAKTGTIHGWSEGWTYLVDTARPYHLWWVVAAALAVTVVPIVAPGDHDGIDGGVLRRTWFLAVAGALTLSTMSVGGDFMHGRTLIPAWLFLLAALSGATTALVPGRPGRAVRIVGPIAVVALAVVQLGLTSRQFRSDRLIIDGIADEMRFYERLDPDLHDLGTSGASPLAEEGRDLRALAELLDTEIGASAGAIGQRAFFGQQDGGDVYVYDIHGLTRVDIARVESIPGGDRVGHVRHAPEVSSAMDRRVDVTTEGLTSFAGYDEAFTIEVGSSAFVLVDLDLIDPLVTAGIVGPDGLARMERFLDEHLRGDPGDLDADLVTFLDRRYHRPDAVRERLDGLADLVTGSSWSAWLRSTAAARAELDSVGCIDDWLQCLGVAIERHRQGALPYLGP